MNKLEYDKYTLEEDKDTLKKICASINKYI